MSYGHDDGCPYPGYPCNCDLGKTDFQNARDAAAMQYCHNQIKSDNIKMGWDQARDYFEKKELEKPVATNHCWPYEKELHAKIKTQAEVIEKLIGALGMFDQELLHEYGYNKRINETLAECRELMK